MRFLPLEPDLPLLHDQLEGSWVYRLEEVNPRPIVQAVVENTLVRVWFSFERGDARLRAVPVVLHREDLFRAGHPQDLPDEFALPEAVSVDKSVSPMFMGFVGTRACT